MYNFVITAKERKNVFKMKALRIIVIILLIGAMGTLIFFGSQGGEGAAPVGALKFVNSYPEFGADKVTFAPGDTHSWPGAIPGGIDAGASDIEKAIYLFLLASYNERDIPCYAYYLDAGGNVQDDEYGISGELFVQSYRIVNNTLIDGKEVIYHRGINYANKLFFKTFNLTAAAAALLSKADHSLYVGDKKYTVLSASKDMSIIDATDPMHPVIGVKWQPASLKISDYDGKVSDWEDIDTTGMTEEEIEFVHRYEWRSYINFLAPNIVESATVEEKSFNGNNYWECKIVVNIPVANADQKTIDGLSKSAGFDNMNFNQYDLTFEVWDIGVFKYINTVESWNGSLPIQLVSSLRLPTSSTAPCYYSYAAEDCDPSGFFSDFNLTVEQFQ
jgi:hypothetical protein